MPHPGDQHLSIVNPFEEQPRRVSEYTAQEIAVLQSRLEKQLGPEYISARAGPSGQKVHYIPAEKCIALANEVFGFNGWSSSIQNIQVDFVDENPQTLKISLGLSVIMRVTLRDGTFHEDIGYGHIENCKGKAAAFEKAKKEGTTDALKRTLRNFGNVLGNCIYDKTYLAKVTKMKVGPTRFDESGLHRHSDFVKKEPVEEVKVEAHRPGPDAGQAKSAAAEAAEAFEDILGEFDEVDFCVSEDDHPDEVALPQHAPSNDRLPANRPPANPPHMQPPSRPLGRSYSVGNTYGRPPQTPNQAPARRQLNGGQQQTAPPNRPQSHSNSSNLSVGSNPSSNAHAGSSNGPPANAEATGFFSARAVNQLPEESLSNGHVTPLAQHVFNPRAESPSIRKTPGIDHSKSKPLGRNGQHVPPPSTQSGANTGGPGTAPLGQRPGTGPGPSLAGRPGAGPPQVGAGRGNAINPQLDQARRIGAPGGPSSPLANRGQYRPPTVINKRQLPSDGPQARPPLADVSNSPDVSPAVGTNAPDVKRQRMA